MFFCGLGHRVDIEFLRVVSHHLFTLSLLIAKRVIGWAEHLERAKARPQQCWPALIAGLHGGVWWPAKRLAANSISVFVGRTRTRSGGGRPRTRWHDGLHIAAEWVQAHPC